MKDRVPLNPGRVLITPENGGAAFYATMTRADNPTQAGDPLNKNTLLKDATAALFGLGESAVPDDVLQVLSRLHLNLGNDHIWKRILELSAEVPAGYTLGEAESVVLWSVTDTESHCGYLASDSVAVDDNGTVTLVDGAGGSTRYTYWDSTYYGNIKGRFINPAASTAVDADAIYYIPSNATVSKSYDESNYYITVSNVQKVIGYAKIEAGTYVDYVNSPNANAYPPSEDDGYTYEYLGQLGDKARVVTGSYTGTGTYGESNPNSLTFPFEPKMVMIMKHPVESDYFRPFLWLWIEGAENVMNDMEITSSTQGNYWKSPAVLNGNTLSWYNTIAATYQGNGVSRKFSYIALG